MNLVKFMNKMIVCLISTCYASATVAQTTISNAQEQLNTSKTQTRKKVAPKTVSGAMKLSKTEFDTLTTKAESGDAKAANQLAMYYDVGLFDKKKSQYWFGISAKGGFPIGQYNYGCVLLRTQTRETVTEALYWLELAQKNNTSLRNSCLLKARQWMLEHDLNVSETETLTPESGQKQ